MKVYAVWETFAFEGSCLESLWGDEDSAQAECRRLNAERLQIEIETGNEYEVREHEVKGRSF